MRTLPLIATVTMCFIGIAFSRDPHTRTIACMICCCMFSIASSRAIRLEGIEAFGTGKAICKSIDDLDIDMPYPSRLRHFVVRDGDALVDAPTCGAETFSEIVDEETKATKWRGPPSSKFLDGDSMSIFVTLGDGYEPPAPSTDVSIFVARAEPAEQLSDTSTMALIQIGLTCTEDGIVKLFGQCGEDRVELAYTNRTIPRTHFLTFTPDDMRVGYCDVWNAVPTSESTRRNSTVQSTSASPVVLNASSHAIGEIVSVAVYDLSAHEFMDDALRGISAHAMQRNEAFARLLNLYRASLRAD